MALNNRYEFVLLFDVKDGNPNGDPDAGNLPRIDAETGRGLVTDVSIKRKVRNFIGLVKDKQPRHEIFIREKAVLNYQIEKAYIKSEDVKNALENWQAWQKDKKNKAKPTRHYEDIARDWMCDNFFDIRAFGAVMTTGDEDSESKIRRTAGQVRGPVQFTFARSVDPVVVLEHSITRMAVTNEKDLEKERTMGRKFTVPYGLYVGYGFVSAFLANQTTFNEDDLELLWQALGQMFEHDRSAARGQMATRGLYVFKHDSQLGNAHAHSLFEKVAVRKKDEAKVPREFSDYEVTINGNEIPVNGQLSPMEGVTLTRMA